VPDPEVRTSRWTRASRAASFSSSTTSRASPSGSTGAGVIAAWPAPRLAKSPRLSTIRASLPTADDIAAMALFLSSPAARNVTGQAISVDGNIEYL
jgi:NAD(P)-dependent dehydrogenase (short-subunit alcohol dehydrogenase family)